MEDFNKNTKEELVSIAGGLRDQLNKTNKKNQKLEEGYIKLSSELRNLKKDKQQIENFFKIIFPKETHETFIHEEFGLYECDELKKVWMVLETKRENEFQKILNQTRQEVIETKDVTKQFSFELEQKLSEIQQLKKNLEESQEQLQFYLSNYKSSNKKVQELENEKSYLLGLIDEKNKAIDLLQSNEIELAELKAKFLLMDDDDNDDFIGKFGNNSALIMPPVSVNDYKKEIRIGNFNVFIIIRHS